MVMIVLSDTKTWKKNRYFKDGGKKDLNWWTLWAVISECNFPPLVFSTFGIPPLVFHFGVPTLVFQRWCSTFSVPPSVWRFEFEGMIGTWVILSWIVSLKVGFFSSWYSKVKLDSVPSISPYFALHQKVQHKRKGKPNSQIYSEDTGLPMPSSAPQSAAAGVGGSLAIGTRRNSKPSARLGNS